MRHRREGQPGQTFVSSFGTVPAALTGGAAYGLHWLLVPMNSALDALEGYSVFLVTAVAVGRWWHRHFDGERASAIHDDYWKPWLMLLHGACGILSLVAAFESLRNGAGIGASATSFVLAVLFLGSALVHLRSLKIR